MTPDWLEQLRGYTNDDLKRFIESANQPLKLLYLEKENYRLKEELSIQTERFDDANHNSILFKDMYNSAIREREKLKAENEWLRKGDYAAIEEGSAEWEHKAILAEKENERLRERIEALRGAIKAVLSSTPTNEHHEYCRIDQWAAWNANKVLAQDEAAG